MLRPPPVLQLFYFPEIIRFPDSGAGQSAASLVAIPPMEIPSPRHSPQTTDARNHGHLAPVLSSVFFRAFTLSSPSIASHLIRSYTNLRRSEATCDPLHYLRSPTGQRGPDGVLPQCYWHPLSTIRPTFIQFLRTPINSSRNDTTRHCIAPICMDWYARPLWSRRR